MLNIFVGTSFIETLEIFLMIALFLVCTFSVGLLLLLIPWVILLLVSSVLVLSTKHWTRPYFTVQPPLSTTHTGRSVAIWNSLTDTSEAADGSVCSVVEADRLDLMLPPALEDLGLARLELPELPLLAGDCLLLGDVAPISCDEGRDAMSASMSITTS